VINSPFNSPFNSPLNSPCQLVDANNTNQPGFEPTYALAETKMRKLQREKARERSKSHATARTSGLVSSRQQKPTFSELIPELAAGKSSEGSGGEVSLAAGYTFNFSLFLSIRIFDRFDNRSDFFDVFLMVLTRDSPRAKIRSFSLADRRWKKIADLLLLFLIIFSVMGLTRGRLHNAEITGEPQLVRDLSFQQELSFRQFREEAVRRNEAKGVDSFFSARPDQPRVNPPLILR
jgi:hypothetical protein